MENRKMVLSLDHGQFLNNLTLLLIGLKVTGYLPNFTWFHVVLPFLIPYVLTGTLLLAAILVGIFSRK